MAAFKDGPSGATAKSEHLGSLVECHETGISQGVAEFPDGARSPRLRVCMNEIAALLN